MIYKVIHWKKKRIIMDKMISGETNVKRFWFETSKRVTQGD